MRHATSFLLAVGAGWPAFGGEGPTAIKTLAAARSSVQAPAALYLGGLKSCTLLFYVPAPGMRDRGETYVVPKHLVVSDSRIQGTGFLLHKYSWIGPPVDAHEKSICQRTEGATTNLRQRTENSRRGKPRSTWSIFVRSIFTSFQNNFPNNARTKIDRAESNSPRRKL